jgi:hypothetical protein
MYKQQPEPPDVLLSAGLSGQAVTGLHLSSSREAGPLIHNIVFHKNSVFTSTTSI